MPRKNLPETVRSLVEIEEEEPPADSPEIANRSTEAKRVAKRISTLIAEHRRASLELGVELGGPELHLVIAALRDHAQGGSGSIDLSNHDEIQGHCLQRLFEELVEEPSNILYLVQTGPDTTRYDAMDSTFWIECLDLLQKQYSSHSQLS